MSARTARVSVYGWELHFTGTRSTGSVSDKYYRVLLLENVALINYGRRGTRGKFIAHVFAFPSDARALARQLTNEKDAGGYRKTRDLTVFELDAQDIVYLAELPIGPHRIDSDSWQWMTNLFRYWSFRQQTELEGASA